MGLLLVVTLSGAHQLWQFVALAALTGVLAAVGNPAGRSLVPELVPAELLTGAIAMRSIAGQVTTIGGPGRRRPPLRDPAGGRLRHGDRAARRVVGDAASRSRAPRLVERVEPPPPKLEACSAVSASSARAR